MSRSDRSVGDGVRWLRSVLRRHPLTRLLVKAVVTVAGGVVVLLGVVLLVTPGPAFVVIPAGLAILATEWPWARRLLGAARKHARRAAGRVRGGAPAGAGRAGRRALPTGPRRAPWSWVLVRRAPGRPVTSPEPSRSQGGSAR